LSTLVVDASVIIAALVQQDDDGAWAEQEIAHARLAAPHLLLVEVVHSLRRFVLTGAISDDVASLAHDELLAMPLELFPYEPCGARVWSLRQNVRPYDAWYVALAELLHAPLATLDQRLSRAAGPSCAFRVPQPRIAP
jgi:predicted nucleic acid-binding protein